jgi:uncharacterized protein (DUF433 family)
MARSGKRTGPAKRRSVFRDTRMPVSAVFENPEAGATIDEIIEQFDISREQINAVLEFASLQNVTT